MNKANVPPEMLHKLDKILSMELDQLNDAYVAEMFRLGRKILNENQPSLEEIYRLLIPEIFTLAAERKRQASH